jgi:tetratricopeptide (TPR) repeat protein
MYRSLLKSAAFILPVLFGVPAWALAQQTTSVADASLSSGAKPSHNTAAITGHVFAFPVMSKSAEAQQLIEKSLNQYENVLLDKSADSAREATEKDPDFALAYALWSFAARQTKPIPEAARKAEVLALNAPAEEQLLVKFMLAVQKSDMLPAIASMNDLLAHFPEDRHALYLTAEWLYIQQDYDRSKRILQQIIKADPNFAPPYNMLGYAMVQTGDPNPGKSIEYLKKYAELEAGQPNPEDSLGEVSRFIGDDQGALEHYHAALQLAPNFITSQTGLGDTYVLMGDFTRASDEYTKALAMAGTERERLHVQYQQALMKFWAAKGAEGRDALVDVEKKAQASHEPYALFEIQEAEALLALTPMERVAKLHEMESIYDKALAGMTESDRNPSLAAIFRDEARILAEQKKVDAAQAVIQKLEKLSASTRDLVVENCYESARGFVFFAQGEFASAGDELSADPHSPLTMQWLLTARQKLGDVTGAEAVKTRLKYLRAPTAEWFLATRDGNAVD